MHCRVFAGVIWRHTAIIYTHLLRVLSLKDLPPLAVSYACFSCSWWCWWCYFPLVNRWTRTCCILMIAPMATHKQLNSQLIFFFFIVIFLSFTDSILIYKNLLLNFYRNHAMPHVDTDIVYELKLTNKKLCQSRICFFLPLHLNIHILLNDLAKIASWIALIYRLVSFVLRKDE